jgi:hypothetical protein
MSARHGGAGETNCLGDVKWTDRAVKRNLSAIRSIPVVALGTIAAVRTIFTADDRTGGR